MILKKMKKILTKKKINCKRVLWLKILNYLKNGHEVIINQDQLDNFLKLGWKQEERKT